MRATLISVSPVARGSVSIGPRLAGAAVAIFLAAGLLLSQTLPGQSDTLLADGQRLLVGGEGPEGVVGAATIVDGSGKTVRLGASVHEPRAGHTATTLPDGTVLIVGGIGASGRAIASPEVFDPAGLTFTSLPNGSLARRAYHTATVLTDGRVLLAGGISETGAPVQTAEIWDPQERAARALEQSMLAARAKHSARLLPAGDVLLWGGTDPAQSGAIPGEAFDAAASVFRPVYSLPTEDLSTDLRGSVPRNGDTVTREQPAIGLRFSRAVRVESANAATTKLTDSEGSLVPAKIVAAEAGMLVFVTPEVPLLAGETYTVWSDGLIDSLNRPVAAASITFTVSGALPPVSTETEDWVPRPGAPWHCGRADSPWQSLPALQGAAGVTALAGQVLRLNGAPLRYVTVRIGGRTAQTDHTGRFLIAPVDPGHARLIVDGRTASVPGRAYGVFVIGVDLLPGRTNALTYTIWIPKTDTAHAVSIPSPTTSEILVTTPLIPGLEIRIPPRTVIEDIDGRPATEISITPVPVDRPPFPLPPGIVIPVFFTVQPGGGYVRSQNAAGSVGARVIYPNYLNRLPGTRANFWDYDPDGRGWYLYGQGKVTADGRQVAPDPGVGLYEFTGTMFNVDGYVPPPNGPTPGCGAEAGDPVDCSMGLFIYRHTDLYLPGPLPISLTRVHDSGDGYSRAFGIGTNHLYDLYFWSARQYSEVDLMLPDGGRIHYPRISSCDLPDCSDYLGAVFEHTATPTVFYKSLVRYNNGGWDLIFRDGTVYHFGDIAPLQSITDRNGNSISLIRANSPRGNITKIQSSSGRYIELSYDSQNRIIRASDNAGRTVTYAYDTGGRLVTVTDVAGATTQYTYDSSGRMATVKDGKDTVHVTNQYDANGRVSLQTLADTGTYQFAYSLNNKTGKVTQADITDPRGNLRRLAFNSGGYVLTDSRFDGRTEQKITYARQSGTNLVVSITDPLKRQTSYVYDACGNTTQVTRLSGTQQAVTTTIAYQPPAPGAQYPCSSSYNRVTGITDPLNHTLTFGYDSKGNVNAITDGLQHQTTLDYNTSGQPITITDPAQKTWTLTYDSGNLSGMSDPLGRSSTRVSDAADRVVTARNALGQATLYHYDALSRLTRIADALVGTTDFSYDVNGNVLSVTDPRSGSTAYTYNNMDRLETRTDPLLKTESYEYDRKGNLARFTDRKQQTTAFTYDAFDRLTQVTYADGASTTYTYDLGNRPTQVVDSQSGMIALTWDGLDRLSQESTPQGTVSYTYDAAGRRTSMTVAAQPTVNYTYDNADRLTQITQGTSTVSFTYDTADRRTSMTLPNGVVTEYGYDTAGQLTNIDYKQGGTLIGDLTYEYDAAGHRVAIGGSFARTGLPEPLTSAAYDAGNRLTQWGTNSLTYDDNGNLTSDGGNTYSWDARDRLASMTGASFQYDPFGRRVSKTLGGTTTQFRYDGVNPVQEISGTAANLLTGLGIDEIFTRAGSAGAQNLLTDAVGSTLALVDSAGAVQTLYTYEPFGRTTASPPSLNSFQYTGREYDTTGLYYYRARYYYPALQRFVSEDPIRFQAGDVNFYAYVGNSPAEFSDPSGLETTAAAGGLTGFGGGLLYATAHQNKPTRMGQARLGRPNAQAFYSWERSFHLDAPHRGAPSYHFNADIGPLRVFNHQRIPRAVYPLGSTSALRGIGYASVGIGIGWDIYQVATATPCTRPTVLGGIAGGWGGALAGAAMGSAVAPGAGTVVGGLVGGIIGSSAGEAVGASLSDPNCGCQ